MKQSKTQKYIEDNILGIKSKPFQPLRLDEEKAADKRRVIPVSFSTDDLKDLQEWKYLLKQEQESTVIKQLCAIGADVLREQKTKTVLGFVLNNNRNNKRKGIITFD